MTRESIDELRERLLRDEGVREMIRARAYELYLIRGDMPGHEAEDWFRAEHEVIAFFIDQETAVKGDVAPDASGAFAEPSAPELPAEAAAAEVPMAAGANEAAVKSRPRKASSSSSPRKKKTSSETVIEGEEGIEKKKSGKGSSAKRTVEGTAKPRKPRSS